MNLTPNFFILKIKSFNNLHLKIFNYYLKFLTKQLIFKNLKINVYQLPTLKKKFTLLKSPHVNKKSRTQYEIKTVTKVYKITNFNFYLKEKILEILLFLNKNLPINIEIEIKKSEIKKLKVN